MTTAKEYTIFIGNPGTGKSSLLNAVIGKVVFESGVSFVSGKTQNLQLFEESKNCIFGDTPGLNDIESRKRAAEEIAKALRSGNGLYKLVFVVTTAGGRINPSDVATIKVVLDALPNPTEVPFGVVVNKVSNTLIRRIEQDQDAMSSLINSLCPGWGYELPTIVFYPRIPELEDEDNILHTPKAPLLQLLENLDSVAIHPEIVSDIDAESFEELIQEVSKTKEELAKAQEAAAIAKEDAEEAKLEATKAKENLEKVSMWQEFSRGFGVGVGGVVATAGALLIIFK